MSIPPQTTTNPTAVIATHFGTLQDPRALHSIDHRLIDIVIITICATIYGADNPLLSLSSE
jgi:hypothetical protein